MPRRQKRIHRYSEGEKRQKKQSIHGQYKAGIGYGGSLLAQHLKLFYPSARRNPKKSKNICCDARRMLEASRTLSYFDWLKDVSIMSLRYGVLTIVIKNPKNIQNPKPIFIFYFLYFTATSQDVINTMVATNITRRKKKATLPRKSLC